MESRRRSSRAVPDKQDTQDLKDTAIEGSAGLGGPIFCNDDVEDYVRLPPTMVSTSEEHSHLHHAMHFDAHTCHSVGCPALSTSVRSIHSNLNLRNLLSNLIYLTGSAPQLLESSFPRLVPRAVALIVPLLAGNILA